MATKATPQGLTAEQEEILKSGNFVLHAVYQADMQGMMLPPIYAPLYVVNVAGDTLHFIAEGKAGIRTMRALNLFDNKPRDMPPKAVSPDEVLVEYPRFCAWMEAQERAAAQAHGVLCLAMAALRGDAFEPS